MLNFTLYTPLVSAKNIEDLQNVEETSSSKSNNVNWGLYIGISIAIFVVATLIGFLVDTSIEAIKSNEEGGNGKGGKAKSGEGEDKAKEAENDTTNVELKDYIFMH